MKCKNNDCGNEVKIRNNKRHKTENTYTYQPKECETCRTLRRRYKLTITQRNELLEKQNHKCKICESNIEFLGNANNFSKHNAVVDHCHTTNKIRGILCGICNSLLGKALDSIDILEASIKYIKSNK